MSLVEGWRRYWTEDGRPAMDSEDGRFSIVRDTIPSRGIPTYLWALTDRRDGTQRYYTTLRGASNAVKSATGS
jgi:hypothetical protein